MEQFHDREIDPAGRVNVARSARILLGVNYDFDGKLYTEVDFRPKRSWSYQGVAKDSFLSAIEVGYTLQENLSLALGVSTDASAIKGNGLESNYTLYDPSQTLGYFDIIISI
jgi:hypothetical protein